MDSKQTLTASKQPKHTNETLPIEDFPAELRRMIWKFTLNDNRIITIHWVYNHSGDLGRPCIAKDFHASYEQIEALTVFSESRSTAHNEYKICFENDLKRPIYFSDKRDILKFSSITLAEIIFAPGDDIWNDETMRNAGVRRIAIDMEGDEEILKDSGHSMAFFLLRCVTLQFLTLEKIFVQPAFVFDSTCEDLFRRWFAKVMQDHEARYGQLFRGNRYKIPEIFLVCPGCDPDFSQAVLRQD